MRTALLLPLMLCLGACSGEPSDSGFLARADAPLLMSVGRASAGARAGTDAVLALPAAAGAVAQASERVYSNGVRQDISLRDESGRPSANEIDISMAKTSATQRAGWLSIGKPSAGGIANEILARFPNQRMQIVTRPMYNALGRFGLAIGRDSSGTRCIFAWQWIDDLRAADPDLPTFRKTIDSLSGQGLPASIRVRLCRRDMTLDQLAALVEGLTLTDPETLRRVASMAGSDATGGGSGTVNVGVAPPGVSSVPESLESALGPAPPPRLARGPGSKPPLRGAASAQNAKRRPPSPDRATRSVAAPSETDDVGSQRAPGGARYLGPVDATEDQDDVAAPSQLPKVQENSTGAPNLPPQAFSGPAPGAAQPPVSADPYGAGAPIGAAP